MAGRGGRGLLIALEGIDGAGKSSLARTLASSLRRRGYSVRRRREPVDRQIGQLAQLAGARDPWTGAVYFTVDRHLALPGLERDLSRFDLVLTDRSYFSTLAYQGSLLPAPERRRLASLERSATLTPDRVVLLDLPVGLALPRVGRRASRLGLARGPLERNRTLSRVARAYRELARQHRWIVLDARRPPAELLREVLERLPLPPPARRRPPKGNRYPRAAAP